MTTLRLLLASALIFAAGCAADCPPPPPAPEPTQGQEVVELPQSIEPIAPTIQNAYEIVSFTSEGVTTEVVAALQAQMPACYHVHWRIGFEDDAVTSRLEFLCESGRTDDWLCDITLTAGLTWREDGYHLGGDVRAEGEGENFHHEHIRVDRADGTVDERTSFSHHRERCNIELSGGDWTVVPGDPPSLITPAGERVALRPVANMDRSDYEALVRARHDL